MDSIWQQTAASLRDRTASDSATPGGGSAACVTGALGLALVLMALRITARKSPSETLRSLIERGGALMDGASAGADADVAAFAQYMSALRLPRRTDVEQEARARALSDAAREATRVPLAAADVMIAGLELALEALPNVAHNVASDVLAGADLLRGAVAAVMRSVDINLASITESAEVESLRQGQRARAARAEELHRDLLSAH